MKASLTLLTLLLAIAALHSEADQGPTPNQATTPCCFSFTSRKIPYNSVESYYSTSTQCPTPGVVFLTKHGKQICANPSDAWVQKHVEQLALQ